MDIPNLTELPHSVIQQIATVLIRSYAAHSYRYYVMDKPVISDGEFDSICNYLVYAYSWVKPYDISDYLDIDALKAGTGYNIAGKVAGLTEDYALKL